MRVRLQMFSAKVPTLIHWEHSIILNNFKNKLKVQNILKRYLWKEMFLQTLYNKPLETIYDTAQAYVSLLRTHRGSCLGSCALLLLPTHFLVLLSLQYKSCCVTPTACNSFHWSRENSLWN